MASKLTPTVKRKMGTNAPLASPRPIARKNLTIKAQPSKADFETAFSVFSPAGASKFSVMARRSKSSTSISIDRKNQDLAAGGGAAAAATITPVRGTKNPIVPSTPECFAPVSMETPRRLAKSSSDITQILDEYKSDKEAEISNLKVAVRVRPMNVKECSSYRVKNVIKVDESENELTVLNGPSADGLSGKSFTFQYDRVFWSCNVDEPNYADQKIIYEELAKPLVDSAFEGYNICLFAYGQTGSGKTYSMMGIDTGELK